MTAEELQSEVQKLAPEGVKVRMSRNRAFVAYETGDTSETLRSVAFDPALVEEIDPLVIAQGLDFEVEVKEKPKRTKQPPVLHRQDSSRMPK